MRLILRLTAIVTFLIVFSVAGVAGQFSFTGNFIDDNDVQLFTFTLLSSGAVTVQTWGYGGGTNAAGQLIAPGGFDSLLTIFDASTGDSAPGSPYNPGGTPCAPRNIDPTTTLCMDAFGQVFLSAGNYILSLTQDPNGPASTNLSDGFLFTDVIPDPNFHNHFFDTPSAGSQRDSHWAVDIVDVDAANEITATPEPATAALFAGALLLAGFWRRSATHN
jgi:hypothetical protein